MRTIPESHLCFNILEIWYANKINISNYLDLKMELKYEEKNQSIHVFIFGGSLSSSHSAIHSGALWLSDSHRISEFVTCLCAWFCFVFLDLPLTPSSDPNKNILGDLKVK